MQPSLSLSVRRYKGDAWEETQDAVVSEVRMRLYLNAEFMASLMCLPEEIEALAVGFLLSEGIASDAGQIREVSVDAHSEAIYVQADVDATAAIQALQKWRTLTSSCGGSTTGQELATPSDCKRIDTQMRMQRTSILDAMKSFQQRSTLFRQTGRG